LTVWLNTSFLLKFRVIDGLTVRFAQSEDPDDHALLLSPWPESLFAFEQMWARLAEHTHLVAIDLPGLGHSQRRDALLTPRAMAEFLVRAADAFGLKHPHVIAPDVGTAAALFAAAAHPVRFRSLVVGGGLSYQGNRFAESMRYLRSYPSELPALAGLLPQVQTPVQIIAGAHDPVIPLANAAFLAQRLPHNKLDVIDAGHFTWEDAADDYAALVTSWWDGGYAATGAAQPTDPGPQQCRGHPDAVIHGDVDDSRDAPGVTEQPHGRKSSAS
jgi:pimeloyl-ACP methyl ester carboxylesterase